MIRILNKSFILLFFLCFKFLPAQQHPVGINLSTISGWSTSWIFVDAMKQASGWFVEYAHPDSTQFDLETVNGQPLPVPLRPDGYPEQVPFIFNGDSFRVHAVTLASQPAPWHYPAGNYTLIFDGTGEIEVDWDVNGGPLNFTASGTPHNVAISNPTDLGVHISIIRSDSSDPVRNIRFIMPGFASTWQNQPFHPRFLEIIQPFPVLRFMKPMGTEENRDSLWSDRTPVDHWSYISDNIDTLMNGMPYELLIRLCNETQKDPWICIPYAANDSFVVQFASMLRDSLDPGRIIYLEYGNETWNPDYPETFNFVNNMGLSLGLDTDPAAAGVRYHTMRSIQVFQLFRTVFSGQTGRFREVLATQGTTYRGNILMDALGNATTNPSGLIPDALAIAPYIGGVVIPNLLAGGLQCSVTVDAVLDSLDFGMARWMDEMVIPFRQWADSMGIELYAYEGGQYLTDWGFGANDSCSTVLITGANRHPRMQDIYCRYYQYWFDSLGGDLFMTFNLTEAYNEYGATGLLESMWQDTSTAPKWRAHNSCVFLTNAAEVLDEKKSPEVFPNPVHDEFTIRIESPLAEKQIFRLFDLHGRLVMEHTCDSSEEKLSRSTLPSGVYFWEMIHPEGGLSSGKLIMD